MAHSPLSAFRRFLKRLKTRLDRNPSLAIAQLSGIFFAVLIAAATLYAMIAGRAPLKEPKPAQELVTIGGPFALIGPDGQTMTDRSFPRQWLLVFFGYTFCPDLCPTTLSDIANAMDALGPYAKRVTPLFVTVDPKRDTPEILKTYTANFDKRIVGLTGSAAAIAAVLKAYRVYAAERPAEDGKGPTLFDHSGTIYLMKPSGAFATVFNAGLPGHELAKGIKAAIEEDPGA
jgi:protein SCO1/2